MLRNHFLAFEVAPKLGGKITSLRDYTGREWLTQPALLPRGSSPRGTRFVEAEMSGWDECAPSVASCNVGDVEIPDHGDLWAQEFESDGASVRAVGTSLGYSFERLIVHTDVGLRLSYRADAIAGVVPFLWAAHPQFVAPPGTYVQLAASIDTVMDVLTLVPEARDWTAALATIDTVPDGGCREVYVRPDSLVSGASLIHPDGAAMAMTWSSNCPYLGIWYDNRRYSREPVIALEPSTGYFDSLKSAIAANRVAVIEPGQPLEWWVDLAVSPIG